MFLLQLFEDFCLKLFFKQYEVPLSTWIEEAPDEGIAVTKWQYKQDLFLCPLWMSIGYVGSQTPTDPFKINNNFEWYLQYISECNKDVHDMTIYYPHFQTSFPEIALFHFVMPHRAHISFLLVINSDKALKSNYRDSLNPTSISACHVKQPMINSSFEHSSGWNS